MYKRQEYIREKGYEILYFTDEADEFVAQALMAYDGKPIQSIASADADLKTDEEKKEIEKQAEENKDLLGFAADVLKGRIKEARISGKLRSQPVCLTAEGPLSCLLYTSAGLDIRDIGLIEANEAFAAQALAVGMLLGWDAARVNVNGGAIALGHPVGASGCRILVSLLHEMERTDIRYGLTTLCVGGGMGVSTIIEKI